MNIDMKREIRETVRLNHFLSQAGVCSRREADRLIGSGRVQVNGERAEVGMLVRQEDLVQVDGREIEISSRKTVFLAVNKPRGVVVTSDRRWGDLLLQDIVDYPLRVFPIGRLDKDSEGLILMTDDGEAANRIQKAREYHEKEYLVEVDKKVTDRFLLDLQAGVWLEDLKVRTRECRAVRTGDRTFDIVLTQGLNRQIRRMCAAFGYQVVRLKRIRVMNVMLGDLKPGQYRELTEREEKELRAQL
jgi:23S rRNA pseudouridine2604 synthase